MKLFENGRIGQLNLKNRIIMPAMGTLLANPGGTVSQRQIDYYARRAKGGAAMVIVEFCGVDPVQKMTDLQLLIHDDRFIPGLSQLARGIKEHGALAVIQLFHPGRLARFGYTGVPPVAPSAIAEGAAKLPVELDVHGIRTIVDYYLQAAIRASAAGFDAVEVHGGHGMLLTQFLSPMTNHRQDEYGGSTEKRTRIVVDIIQATRQALGSKFGILLRLSADEHVLGGIDIGEAKAIARIVERAGADALNVSAGTWSTMEWYIQPLLLPPGCLVPLAAEIKKVVGIPVITAGRINTPQLAEKILADGKADFIAMGRGLIADPDLPLKARLGRFGDITRCIACNCCQNEVGQQKLIGCLLNPEAGKENVPKQEASRRKSVVVLGGSPASVEAACVALDRGHKVSIWDENAELGGRWPWVLRPYFKTRQRTLARLNAELRLGKPYSWEDVAKERPDVVIGPEDVKPILPEIPGIGQGNVILAADVLDRKVKPTGRVVVLGGGSIGCETAWLLRGQKLSVTVLEPGDSIGEGFEKLTRRIVAARLHKMGVSVLTNCQAQQIAGSKVYCVSGTAGERVLETDYVVVALGTEPSATSIDPGKLGFKLYRVPWSKKPTDAYACAQAGIDLACAI